MQHLIHSESLPQSTKKPTLCSFFVLLQPNATLLTSQLNYLLHSVTCYEWRSALKKKFQTEGTRIAFTSDIWIIGEFQLRSPRRSERLQRPASLMPGCMFLPSASESSRWSGNVLSCSLKLNGRLTGPALRPDHLAETKASKGNQETFYWLHISAHQYSECSVTLTTLYKPKLKPRLSSEVSEVSLNTHGNRKHVKV